MDRKYVYKAEYAKSNRGKCKSCENLIEKDALRLVFLKKVVFLCISNMYATSE